MYIYIITLSIFTYKSSYPQIHKIIYTYIDKIKKIHYNYFTFSFIPTYKEILMKRTILVLCIIVITFSCNQEDPPVNHENARDVTSISPSSFTPEEGRMIGPVVPPATQNIQVEENSSRPPTPEEERFAQEVLFPTMNYIRYEYPLPTLRRMANETLSRIEEEVPIQFNISREHRDDLDSALAGVIHNSDGSAQLIFFIPELMQTYNCVGQWDFIDMFLVTVLHEGYHLFEQDIQHNESHADYVQNESEALWWTVESVYIPLSRGGHMLINMSALTKYMIHSYKNSRSRRSDAWRQFMRVYTLDDTLPVNAHTLPHPFSQ